MKKFFITTITLIISLFLNYQYTLAAPENIEDSIQSKNDQGELNVTKDNQDKSKSSAEDLFGDEQTFPFVAGLGKNAAH
tara:strand:- start:507 stop:743 length:237 start_codon:yes stop_codon:yes gene_type:complete